MATVNVNVLSVTTVVFPDTPYGPLRCPLIAIDGSTEELPGEYYDAFQFSVDLPIGETYTAIATYSSYGIVSPLGVTSSPYPRDNELPLHYVAGTHVGLYAGCKYSGGSPYVNWIGIYYNRSPSGVGTGFTYISETGALEYLGRSLAIVATTDGKYFPFLIGINNRHSSGYVPATSNALGQSEITEFNCSQTISARCYQPYALLAGDELMGIANPSIANAVITLTPGSFLYDGQAKEPAVTVVLNGITLTQDTDYTVRYVDNIGPGRGSAVVTGIGSYGGSGSKTFIIRDPLSFNSDSFLQGLAVGRQLRGWATRNTGGGYPAPSGSVAISSNGSYDVAGKAQAVVSVPNSYTASDEGKVVSSGALAVQTSRTVTENGTYDTTSNDEVVVNVSGSGGGGGTVLYDIGDLYGEPSAESRTQLSCTLNGPVGCRALLIVMHRAPVTVPGMELLCSHQNTFPQWISIFQKILTTSPVTVTVTQESSVRMAAASIYFSPAVTVSDQAVQVEIDSGASTYRFTVPPSSSLRLAVLNDAWAADASASLSPRTVALPADLTTESQVVRFAVFVVSSITNTVLATNTNVRSEALACNRLYLYDLYTEDGAN